MEYLGLIGFLPVIIALYYWAKNDNDAKFAILYTVCFVLGVGGFIWGMGTIIKLVII